MRRVIQPRKRPKSNRAIAGNKRLLGTNPSLRHKRVASAERAKFAEERRNTSLAKYHNFEIASAALEIGIVLASATIITGITVLAWIAGTLGVVGLAFMGIALIAPHTVHVL